MGFREHDGGEAELDLKELEKQNQTQGVADIVLNK